MARSRRTARHPLAAASAARSAQARARQMAEAFAPLTPTQTVEAESYIVAALEGTIAEFGREIDAVRGQLADVPSPAAEPSAAGVEATALAEDIVNLTAARDDLAETLDAVHNRRRFSLSAPLAMATFKAGSRKLLGDAARLGVAVDGDALAEARRREWLMAGWLMDRGDAGHAGDTAAARL